MVWKMEPYKHLWTCEPQLTHYKKQNPTLPAATLSIWLSSCSKNPSVHCPNFIQYVHTKKNAPFSPNQKSVLELSNVNWTRIDIDKDGQRPRSVKEGGKEIYITLSIVGIAGWQYILLLGGKVPTQFFFLIFHWLGLKIEDTSLYN